MRALPPLLVALSVLAAAPASAIDGTALRQEMSRYRDSRGMLQLDDAAFQQARILFRRTLALKELPPPDLEAAWSTLGYRLVRLDGESPRFALLPQDRTRAVQGVFLFDPAARNRNVLQVPHPLDDLGTGELALQLFFAGGTHAVMIAAVPRATLDLAREPHSLFTAYAAELARLPEARLLQLHGFERGKRSSDAGRVADSVVSAGQRRPTAATLALRECLQRQLGGMHRVYGVDIDELGGTRNPSRAPFPSRQTGTAGFVHLELSRELRDRLLSDRSAFERFRQCLAP